MVIKGMQEAASAPDKPKCDTDTVYRKKNEIKKEEKEANAGQPLTLVWYCDVWSESEHCNSFPRGR